MGIFDRLILFGHREMAMVLKKHAVSVTLTSVERDLLRNLNLDETKFVGERVLMLCSFIHSCLAHLGDSQGHKILAMVRPFYDIYVEEHFKTLPGVDKDRALKGYLDAQDRYGLQNDKETLYPTFLEYAMHDYSKTTPSASANKSQISDEDFRAFCAVMDSYTKGSIDLIKKQLARINPADY